MSKLVLLAQIEACREKLLTLSSEYELTSQPVLESSMELDQLINQYQKYDKQYELASQ